MIAFKHEKYNIDFEPSGGKPRASFEPGSDNSRGPYGNKDSGSVADIGGSASGMDRRDLGSNASKPERLDPQGKRGGSNGLKTEEKAWPSLPFNPRGSSGTGRGFREAPFRAGAK